MKLSSKLYGIVGALALAGLAMAGCSFWYLHALKSELNTATQKTAVKMDLVNSAQARSWEVLAANGGLFLTTYVKDKVAFEERAKQSEAAFTRLHAQVAEIRQLLVTEQSQKDLATFEAALADFSKTSAEYARLCRENKLDQVNTLTPKVQEFSAIAGQTLNNIRDMQLTLLKESQERAASIGTESTAISTVALCLLVAAIPFAIFFMRGISRTLVTAVGELAEGAHQVAAAANQVASSSQSLAQGSSEQAASLEETSASSEEIQSMARKNSENTRDAADLVTGSQHSFTQMNQLLDQMVVAIGDINTQSGKISKIIKVIDEIAFQTNILALNAAVEAARAGEAGMGFAVVADEVRNLAQRCAQAAKDTSALIEESISKSSEGKTKVDQVSTAIRAVTEESGKVKTLVDEVNLGSQEQTRGIEQIGKAINQMEQVTQKTAANAEESAAAAEELNAQSEQLNKVVEQLSVMVGIGESTQSHTPRRPKAASQPRSESIASPHSSESTGSLAALRTALHSSRSEAGMPVRSAAGSAKSAFPLDEQFKEF